MRHLRFLFFLLAIATTSPGSTLVDRSVAQSAQNTPTCDIRLPNKEHSTGWAVAGDAGTGGKEQYEVARLMSTCHSAFPYDFVLLLGDNLYGGESPKDFRRKFEEPYAPLLQAGVKFYAALGNHDQPDQRFYKNFNMGGQRYYAFDKGPIRFFALDSNYMTPEQLEWLEKELKSTTKRWKIAFLHHPLYSSGGTHGSDIELRKVLEPLFIKYGVDVVLAGHEHFYERIKPQKDIVYFTSGAAGKLREGDVEKKDFSAAAFDKDRSFMLFEVDDDTLYFQSISRTGQTVDSGSIRPRAPAKPEALTKETETSTQGKRASGENRSPKQEKPSVEKPNAKETSTQGPDKRGENP